MISLGDDIVSQTVLTLGTAIAAVAGTAAVHAGYEYATRKVKTRTKLAWALAMFGLAVNATLVSLALRKMEQIERASTGLGISQRLDALQAATNELRTAQRIEARFYPAADAYGEMRRIIGEAKEHGTIYALNSFEVPFKGLYASEADAGRAEAARKRYFSLIEEKMGHVNYQRVVQVRDAETLPLAELVGPTYVAHFRKIVGLQDQGEGEISTTLQVAHSHFSMSFVIVENSNATSYLIWQVDKRLTNISGYKAAGYMIVSDPEQIVIRHFKALFNQVIKEKGVRRVRMEDLAEHAPSTTPGL